MDYTKNRTYVEITSTIKYSSTPKDYIPEFYEYLLQRLTYYDTCNVLVLF